MFSHLWEIVYILPALKMSQVHPRPTSFTFFSSRGQRFEGGRKRRMGLWWIFAGKNDRVSRSRGNDRLVRRDPGAYRWRRRAPSLRDSRFASSRVNVRMRRAYFFASRRNRSALTRLVSLCNANLAGAHDCWHLSTWTWKGDCQVVDIHRWHQTNGWCRYFMFGVLYQKRKNEETLFLHKLYGRVDKRGLKNIFNICEVLSRDN